VVLEAEEAEAEAVMMPRLVLLNLDKMVVKLQP
jgi:hypothetical protein